MYNTSDLAILYLIFLGIVAVLKLNEVKTEDGWQPISLTLNLPNNWCRIIARSCMATGIILITAHCLIHDSRWYYAVTVGILGSYGIMTCMSFIAMIFCETAMSLIKLVIRLLN